MTPRPLLVPRDPSRSGAARISAMWLIVLVVLFLVSIAFAFVSQSDLAKSEKSLQEARQAASEAQATTQEEAQTRRGISAVLGFFPSDAADPSSNVEAATQALSGLRDAFPNDIGQSDQTFEAIVPKVIAAYAALGQKVTELEGRVTSVESELKAAQDSATKTAGEKDGTIAQLRQQLADEQQNAANRQQDLEDRLTAAQQQTSERDADLRTAKAGFADERRGLEQQIARDKVRIGELSRVTRFSKPPFADQPDGSVLSVSDRLPIGWIDIGANQRLTRGTRFRVESSTPGKARLKAWAEVTSVESNRAEVLFSDLTDPFDPPAPGDVVVNPLFDPVGGRNAVLVGRFSGEYNREDLKVLLERMGIHVQDKLDLTTHFLIVGAELYVDPDHPENGPLDEPIQPSDLPVYKQAEEQQVQIIPLQDLREFFRPDTTAAGQ